MKKLANISQFESLQNQVIAVQNGWLSNKIGVGLANRLIMKNQPKNIINYTVAMKKGKKIQEQLASEGAVNEYTLKNIAEGFKLFGKFCANLNVDLSKIIDNTEVNIGYYKRPHSIDGAIYLNPADDAGTIAHELIHQIYYHPKIEKAVKSNFGYQARLPIRLPSWFPKRYASIYDADGELYPHDRLRAWIAGDDYAGQDNGLGMGDEYLPQFLSNYAQKKIPLLYAIDVKRLINKINRMVRKQQNGKTR